jgi:hypothetical protein
MGLDMHLTGNKFFWSFHGGEQRHEDGFRVKAVDLDLGYWRKHPDLHGFIVQAFAEGNDDQRQIELDATAIRCIITAVKDKRLPHTEGFFFGRSGWEHGEDQWKVDVEILERALAWLEAEPGGEQPRLGVEVPLSNSGLSMRAIPMPTATMATEHRTVVYQASW